MSSISRRAMVMGAAIALAWTAASATGCAVPQSQNVAGATGNEKEPITGQNYYLYLPTGYNPAHRYPLVVSIHGMKPFDNAFPQLMTWRKICDENGWIAMAPQLKSPDMLNQFPFRRVDASILQDEALIVASVQDVIRRFSVDTRYVMITGWSSGGYLIHYVGARHPELVTLIVPQGANFSEDIMPDYVTEAARQTPVYLYHGSLDLPMVVKDSNAAAAWYQRHGYRSVQMDEAPGGHERHPELAARYFSSHISGLNSATATARLLAPAKTELLAEPWLTSAVAAPTAGPATPAYASAPPARTATLPPGPPVASSTYSSTPPARPAGAVIASATPSAAPYSWDRVGPVRSTGSPPTAAATAARPAAAPTPAAPTPAAAPTVTPTATPVREQLASERFATPAIAAASRTTPTTPAAPRNTTGVVNDFPAPVPTPVTGPVAMPVGPDASPPTGNNAVTANVRDVSPFSPPARVQTPQVTVTPVTPSLAMAAPRPVTPADLPTPAGDLTPLSPGRNPVAAMAPTAPARRTASVSGPQPISSPNHTSVRIVPSAQDGFAPLTVEFRAEIQGVNSPIVRYRWRLEDKLFSTAHFGVLTFQQAGEYPIDLMVTDAAGNSYRNHAVIRVSASQG